MKVLDVDGALDRLPQATRSLATAINLGISADDGMYATNGDWHYLNCGASALNVILAAQQLADVPAPSSILDFGAGAGRVTRWLRAAFPDAHISACDLRTEDMRFCRDQFRADTWVSGTDIAALSAPGRYDLIWVGSVLTHLSAAQARDLIDKFLGWLNVGGLLVMSTIGRNAYTRRDTEGMAFIHDHGWHSVVKGFAHQGYGYADYQNETGYGLSLIKLSWLATLFESLPSTRLVALAECVWDDLHDIIAVQSIEATPLARVEVASALTRVVPALRHWSAATLARRPMLWTATRPLRSVLRWVQHTRKS